MPGSDTRSNFFMQKPGQLKTNKDKKVVANVKKRSPVIQNSKTSPVVFKVRHSPDHTEII
jgi:hypothetical protein